MQTSLETPARGIPSVRGRRLIDARPADSPGPTASLLSLLREHHPACDPKELERTVNTFLTLFRQYPNEFMLAVNKAVIEDPAEALLFQASRDQAKDKE